MKRISAILFVILLLCAVLSGCTEKDKTLCFSVLLSETPIETEKPFEFSKKGSVIIEFDVPESGLIKLLAYDNTEYTDWPDEEAEFYVDFKNESGEILYENVCISNGYVEKYKFDAGKVTAEITAENEPSDIERICLSWAYAAENYQYVDIDYQTDSAAVADENGVARFRLNVDNASLIRISPAEACVYESDCLFNVETANGEKVTDDLTIHGTEWTPRLVFLPKGKYVIAVSDIDAVATCSAKIEKSYTAVQLDSVGDSEIPVVFGFNAVDVEERTAKFTADSSKKYLVINAMGDGTFYDSVHRVDAVISDANGNVVARAENDSSDETRIDVSSLNGEYAVTISTEGSCAVELSII